MRYSDVIVYISAPKLDLLGSEGGTASGGFIGVYELGVYGFTDSDNDGIPDAWMVKYFGHPTGQASDKSLATDDPDSDGLTNLQEYKAGTNPTKADTDGDGLNDGAEVNTTHTNPLAPDTDSADWRRTNSESHPTDR